MDGFLAVLSIMIVFDTSVNDGLPWEAAKFFAERYYFLVKTFIAAPSRRSLSGGEGFLRTEENPPRSVRTAGEEPRRGGGQKGDFSEVGRTSRT